MCKLKHVATIKTPHLYVGLIQKCLINGPTVRIEKIERVCGHVQVLVDYLQCLEKAVKVTERVRKRERKWTGIGSIGWTYLRLINTVSYGLVVLRRV